MMEVLFLFFWTAIFLLTAYVSWMKIDKICETVSDDAL